MTALATSSFTESQILACLDAIRRQLPVLEVWIFGSTARGEANEDSDLDLLVVLPEDHKVERPCYQAKLAIAQARTGVPTDVVIITESEARHPSSCFIEDALQEGVRIA
jgi:predicted nucleotidyltransferase